jgi:hypothetical protein
MSAHRKYAEPISERAIEEMELPEAFIEHLKATGDDSSFYMYELSKFFDDIN